MTESEAKIELAKKQNQILNRIYLNINEDGFNLNVNLDDFPKTTLMDFWLYTAGFLGVKNTEELNEMLSEDEITDMLEGKFLLKKLTTSQAIEIAAKAGKKLSSQVYDFAILYTIQDGTYTVHKGLPHKYTFINCISLKCDPIEYKTDKDIDDIKPFDIFKNIRNIFAHASPYINGRKLTFIKDDIEIVVSKMWLRGYSEMFSRKSSLLNSSEITEKLRNALELSRNYIDNEKDLDKALSEIKNMFEEDIQEKYYRVNTFVKNRVQYTRGFYQKPFDEKIKIIASICANNPSYMRSSIGRINSSIMYNLQNITAHELASRNESAFLSDEDLNLKEFERLHNEYLATEKTYNELISNLKIINNGFIKAKINDLENKIYKLKKQIGAYIKNYEEKRKLESSHMDIYELTELEHLPVEVGVNVVCLMAFNSLATSGFYEEVLKFIKFNDMNTKQEIFFKQFNLDKITRIVNGNKVSTAYDSGSKAFTLLSLRNAICHGNVFYSLPPVKQGENVSFKDVVLTFDAPKQNARITGRLEDFYSLFSNPGFTKIRNEEIISKNTKHHYNNKGGNVRDSLRENMVNECLKSDSNTTNTSEPASE